MSESDKLKTIGPGLYPPAATDEELIDRAIEIVDEAMEATSVVIPSVQQSVDRRAGTRVGLRRLEEIIQEQLDLENDLVEDEPEGTVVIQLQISKTLAQLFVSVLKTARAWI